MLIGDLVKKTGFSRDTIRFYEKQGLIQLGKKERRENNYKEYSAQTLDKLLTIKRIKGFGFTLNEISEFLELIDNNIASCENVADKVIQKVEAINQKIKELEQLKTTMINGVQKCTDCCTNPATDNCWMLTTDEFV